MRQALLMFFLLVGVAPISHSEVYHGPAIEPSGLFPPDAESLVRPEVHYGPAIEPSGND